MRVFRFAVLVLLLPLVWAPAALADLADEQALAERYAPVVRLVAQAQECGYGESYEPIDVDLLFDEPTVAFRGPWGGDLVQIAPSATDLSAQRYEYHLDFPGHALDPGCDYERWSRRLTEGHAPTVYAHVSADPAHPGKLALQYWFYYVFNDWNNTHEGDWEMIQLVFDADNARDALSREPLEVGYSQHEGAERAAWRAEKLEVVDGTHPVVHPAAGSHANFYDEALFVGSSASEGVGCDNTSGPTRELRPVVKTIPADPAQAREAFPWIAFEGRWGELQRAFFNGPTGPNLKSQWTAPITWSKNWRDRSIAVPGGGALGTGATDFFCDAVAAGSNAVRRLADDPLPVLAVLAALLLLVLLGLTRTTWRPTAPLRLAHRRAWGQVLAASGNMYVRRLGLFVGIGLLALPISIVITILQALVVWAFRIAGVDTSGQSGGVFFWAVVAIGTALTLLGLGLVQAATVRALVELDADRPVGPVRAFRLAFERVGSLVAAVSLFAVAVTLLLSSFLLIPIAIWLAVRWALIVPVIELEGASAGRSLRRSARLVRQGWLKVGSIVVVGAALALAVGPLLGALLILVTSIPLAWLNVVSGLVYVVSMPFVSVATAYVYFDMRARDEAAEAEPAELPAAFELSVR